MSDEQSGDTSSSPPLEHGKKTRDQGATAQALAVLSKAKEVTGRPRQIFLASAIGVCLVFLAAYSGLPHLDTALQVAVIAFVVAIALLSWAFILASYTFEPGLKKWDELLTMGLQLGGWAVGEGIGTAAVVVGVTAAVWHINNAIVLIGYGSFLAGIVLILTVAAVYAIVGALREARKDKSKAEQSAATPTAVPTPPSTPGSDNLDTN